MKRIEAYVRKSELGDWIAAVYIPMSPSHKFYGWTKYRRASPEDAAQTCANVVRHYLAKHALFRESARAMRAKERGE